MEDIVANLDSRRLLLTAQLKQSCLTGYENQTYSDRIRPS